MQSVYRHRTWSGRFVLAEGTRGIDAYSGLEAFCRGDEDGLLSVKKKVKDSSLGVDISEPVAPVAYQVILEPCVGQFREFEPPRVHTNSYKCVRNLFLVPKLTCGKRESVS